MRYSNAKNRENMKPKKYDVKVRYTFEGVYTVVADNRDEAKRMVREQCGLVMGGNIHTNLDDDEVLDWDFDTHPETNVVSALIHR